MNRSASLALAIMVGFASIGSTGCGILKFFEKKVPDDIVQKALTQTLRHAPVTASAMCGADTAGLASSTVTIKTRGEKSTGTAHVVGTPWPGEDTPSKCEGDIEFAFSYSTKTYGSRRNRRTETTWFLDKMKLTAVQTKGVKFKEGKDETPTADEADDEEGDKTQKASKGSDKKKKAASDDD